MIVSAPAIVSGAACGIGAVIAATGLMRPRADLGDLLRRMDAGRLENLEPRAVRAPNSVLERIGGRLLAQVGEGPFRLPQQELDLLGRTPAQHMGRKLGYALIGLLLPCFTVASVALAGSSMPFALPALAGVALAVLFSFLPDIQVREEAAAARREFRFAIASYLELVCLERAADAGPSEALRKAADIGEGWVFSRLRDALTRAELAGIPPWEGLKQLSEELGVPELGAPADIMALAGEEGAAVYSTLQAQARSLRGVLLTDAQAEANAASEKMIVPVTALVIIMSIWIGYPAIARIMAA
ncbi:type II secretion system F family protein [Streptomyces sp. NRRL B-24484]|uniref:type II secretion system F family protein n=1 Tax=Streptomyces sp. NRRL B-24484 TaxID=1463833 RepID=UPI00069353A1|nr:type II secretion system F family protein [Streptomyces sp. NRRL B-24484]